MTAVSPGTIGCATTRVNFSDNIGGRVITQRLNAGSVGHTMRDALPINDGSWQRTSADIDFLQSSSPSLPLSYKYMFVTVIRESRVSTTLTNLMLANNIGLTNTTWKGRSNCSITDVAGIEGLTREIGGSVSMRSR